MSLHGTRLPGAAAADLSDSKVFDAPLRIDGRVVRGEIAPATLS